MYSIAQIAPVIHAQWLQQQADAVIEHILLDSRKLVFPKTSLFFALGGPRRNGNFFIGDLYARGVRNFIIDTSFDTGKMQQYSAANFLQVQDVLDALHVLIAFHRSRFDIPVIGITGSNGKTIVKEWLYQLLQQDYSIIRSPKSYNSQIGVPLSVWPMSNKHTLGIFEAGISQPGEMQRLQPMIQPTLGVFTNIGEAHSAGFESIEQKVAEKIQLFKGAGTIVYCRDEQVVHEGITATYSPDAVNLFTWGRHEEALLHIVSTQVQPFNTVIKAEYKAEKLSISVPFTNDAAINNAITCWCVLLHNGVSHEVISERMLQLKPVEMRLELKQGINNCSVINDSYSADINSLSIALDFLQQQQQHTKRTVIISDILQSGKSGRQLYEEVAGILLQKNISRFIGIGPEICRQQEVFATLPNTAFFTSVADFKEQFHTLHFYNETILLKGARIFEFEQISHLLEAKAHQTVLEINLTAITHNLKQYQQLLAPGVKMMAMVKAFSYGSGSYEIANLLQFHKVDYLAVAFADEGVELRKAGITLPVMVMSPEESTFDALVQYNLEPELYSFEILNAFRDYLSLAGIENFPVHIKFDTGMHRLGFEMQDMEQLTQVMQSSNRFKIQSAFSHLAASDSSQFDDFTQQQASLFNICCDALQQAVNYPVIRHIANTSAIMRHPNLQYDMVRLGIGLYGVDSNVAMQQNLQNVATLKTTIAQVRRVKAGDSIGYSRAGMVKKDTTIATVRIGYADGYPRLLGNGKGKMLVGGKLAPVIGNVCMDMTMLDIGKMDAKAGDEVIVFGKDLPVTTLSDWAKTIAYEILAGISQRVQRVYYEE
ncbi:MAG TPA: bifunctional UDP-N-acetylmuramoyl-tripeptide:D-alanyl-D-alanine ligase/alanine racemase [Ferruginibacter sp.]|nr:bifunctional UDP-N-acetylmuramoyl-tripeptide:D-alanyl-D-alanine ligase/alanine racemase [Ferruginibacter sp.]HMP21078.1 bifunctional UDP-N-acetylmuramoyl-tripeptide:D-alanyl-D-alanine ligase/alanine racemase [Ferruginibacter sp.]